MRPDPKSLTVAEAADLVRQHGGIRAAAKSTGYAFGTMRNRYQRAVTYGMADPDQIQQSDETGLRPEDALDGRVEAMHTQRRKLPRRGRVNRYILTCAQNNTLVFCGTRQSVRMALSAMRELNSIEDLDNDPDNIQITKW